jgi:hypothetical protein
MVNPDEEVFVLNFNPVLLAISMPAVGVIPIPRRVFPLSQ